MTDDIQPQQQERTLLLLIVDDNDQARSGLKALLDTQKDRWKNVGIIEATNGLEAQTVVESHQPDVVLMDVHMPGLNGIEAARRIKARWPSTKLVMLTMHAAHRKDALAAGADAFLLKGGPTEELLSAIFE